MNLGARLRTLWFPAVVAGVELVRMVVALRRPDGRLANTICDDAFYYLVLAKNFASVGRWTFDGVEPASGFHLLWGYLLAGIYWVSPVISLHATYLVLQLVQTACLAAAAWLSVRTAARLFGAGGEAGVALVFLSALSLTVGEMMMESSLVILFSALAIELACRTECKVWFALLIGFGGVLARSDFGLLALCLFGMQGVLWRRQISTSSMVRVAGAMLAGALAGTAFVAEHTHWISGEWVQSSARQKLFWAGLVGFSSAPVRHLVLEFFDVGYYQIWSHPLANLGAHGARVAAAVLMVATGQQAWVRRRVAAGTVLTSMGCVVALYLFFYRYNSDEMQRWYVASFEVPLATLSAGAVAWLVERWRRTTLLLIGVFCVCGVGFTFRPQWGEDAELYTAGVYLMKHPELRPAAAWNAGQIGYFSAGGVINLDGLVNDRVYAYAKSDSLARYVALREVRTIVDFSVMLDRSRTDYGQPELSRRGGYSDGELERCVMVEDALNGTTASPAVIFHIVPGCLARSR